MIRILGVTHDWSLTGAPLVLHQLLKNLKGYSCIVRGGGPSSSYLPKMYEEAGVQARYFNPCMVDYQAVDLVIANTLLSYQAVLQAKELNIPCLWWIHEGEWATKQLWNWDMLKALDTTTRIVVSSKYLQNIYNIYNMGWQSKIELIPYAAERTTSSIVVNQLITTDSMGAKPEVKGSPVNFLVAGTVEWRKGQDIALRAFKQVQATHPGTTLTLVGGGWDSPYAQQIAEKTIGTTGITCLLPRPPEAFQKLLVEADVLLVPSRDEGGYPQVLLQAQEMGKLVIGSNVCGIADQLAIKEAGRICNTPEDWVYWMEWACEEPEWRGAVGASARDYVHTHNSLESHIAKWDTLIHKVVR